MLQLKTINSFPYQYFERAEYNKNTLPPGGNGMEPSNKEIERNIVDEGYIIEEHYPVSTKLNFSTLDSFV